MIALDFALEAVARAGSTKVKAVAGRAEEIPLRDGAREVIVGLEVIEHLANPDAFVADVARTLTPDGMFICSTPNRLVRNPRLLLNEPPLNPWHLREWSPQEFHDVLAARFERVDIYGQVPQTRSTTQWFDRLGRVSKRGAAILRQLLKFRLTIRPPRGVYDVRPCASTLDYEFIVCVCTRPTGSIRSHR